MAQGPDRVSSAARPSLFATIGQLRELTEDLPDDTPIVVVIRKAHDADYFYGPVFAEADPHLDLVNREIVITAPEGLDFGT